MYVSVLLAFTSVYHTCISAAHRDRKRVSDSLQLELWMTVSYHVLLGIQTGSMEEQSVFLTAESSFQPTPFVFETGSNHSSDRPETGYVSRPGWP